MWSRKPTPVVGATSPPSRSSSSETLVSPVFRSIFAVRAIGFVNLPANRLFSSAARAVPTRRAPAGPRPSRSRRSPRRASPPPRRDLDDRHAPPERAHAERAGEPRRAAGRQDVVRPGGVVAERGRAPLADEDATRDARQRRPARRPSKRSSRCSGANASTARARASSEGASTSASGASATLGRLGGGASTPLGDRVQRGAVGRDRRRAGCRRRARPARAGRGDQRGVRARVEDDASSLGPASPSTPTSPKSWRFASVTQALPGPATTSTASIVSVPERKRGDRVSAADA